MYVNEKIYTPDVVIGTKNPPGFEGSKQAEAVNWIKIMFKPDYTAIGTEPYRNI